MGHSVCPRSLASFYIVTYYIELVKTSWTYSTLYSIVFQYFFRTIILHLFKKLHWTATMVLKLDGKSEIGAHHVRSNLCYLICLRHLIRSRAVTDLFSPKRSIFLHACATRSELPSNISSLKVVKLLFRSISSVWSSKKDFF